MCCTSFAKSQFCRSPYGVVDDTYIKGLLERFGEIMKVTLAGRTWAHSVQYISAHINLLGQRHKKGSSLCVRVCMCAHVCVRASVCMPVCVYVCKG